MSAFKNLQPQICSVKYRTTTSVNINLCPVRTLHLWPYPPRQLSRRTNWSLAHFKWFAGFRNNWWVCLQTETELGLYPVLPETRKKKTHWQHFDILVSRRRGTAYHSSSVFTQCFVSIVRCKTGGWDTIPQRARFLPRFLPVRGRFFLSPSPLNNRTNPPQLINCDTMNWS